MRHDRWVNQWTEERLAKLRELWPDPDMSTARIAEEIGGGLSRSAVIGKGNRLGLGPKPTRTASATGGARVLNRTRKAKRNFGGVWAGYPYKSPEPFVQRKVTLESLRLTITEVSAFQCRYIEGDDGLCCGHPVTPGTPWCPAHHAIVYQAPKERSEKQKAHDAKLGQHSARRSRTEATAWMAEEAA